MNIVIPIVAIAAIFGAAYVVRVRYQRRVAAGDDEMHSWASTQGYDFAAADDSRIGPWSFRPFDIGTHRHAKRVVSGTFSGRTFVAFDYTYETSGGPGPGTVATNNNMVWHFAVCIVQLPASLPDIAVDAKGVRDKVHLGSDSGIDLGDPEFGRHYRVRCNDPQMPAAVLPAATRSRLVSSRLTGVHITGDQLIAWQSQTHNKTEVLPERLTVLTDLVAAIPASAWQS